MEISLKWFCSRGTVLRFLTSYFICMHFLCLVVTGMLNLSAVIGLVTVKWKKLLSQLFRGRDESIHQRGGEAGGEDESASMQGCIRHFCAWGGWDNVRVLQHNLKPPCSSVCSPAWRVWGIYVHLREGRKKGLLPVVCDIVSWGEVLCIRYQVGSLWNGENVAGLGIIFCYCCFFFFFWAFMIFPLTWRTLFITRSLFSFFSSKKRGRPGRCFYKWNFIIYTQIKCLSLLMLTTELELIQLLLGRKYTAHSSTVSNAYQVKTNRSLSLKQYQDYV